MEQPKKHKRSGSYVSPAASQPLPRRKKSLSGSRTYGKYSGGKPKKEKKNIDVNIVTAAVTTLPALSTPPTRLLLNTYTAGTGATNSLGRRVLNKSLLLRMVIAQPLVNGVINVGPTGCRVIVVYDREANGAAPATADMFTDLTAGSCAANNLDNSERFLTLVDEKFTLGQMCITAAPASAASAPTTYMVDRYVKIKLDSIAKSTFNGTVANISTGSIYLIAFSDVAAGSNPPQIVSGYARIRFEDA